MHQTQEKLGHCHWCGKLRAMTRDHVIPKSKGGTDDETNLVGACFACNQLRGKLSQLTLGKPSVMKGGNNVNRLLTYIAKHRDTDPWLADHADYLTTWLTELKSLYDQLEAKYKRK